MFQGHFTLWLGVVVQILANTAETQTCPKSLVLFLTRGAVHTTLTDGPVFSNASG